MVKPGSATPLPAPGQQVESDETLVSSAELASWLGCSTRTIRAYEAEGLISQQGRGKFALKRSVLAVVESMRARAAGWVAQSSESGEVLSPAAENAALARQKRLLAIEQTRVAATRAEVAEQELRVLRGEVAEMTQIISSWGLIITAAKSRFLGLAPRLATQIHGLDRRDISIISDEVRDILDQLVADGEAIIANAGADAIKRKRAAEKNTDTAEGETEDD